MASEKSSWASWLQYLFIVLTLLVPAIWKMYNISPAFRYQAKMTLYVSWVFLVSFLIIPVALIRGPRRVENTKDVARWLWIEILRVKQVFGITIVQRGVENFKIPGDGSYVVVSNHQSSLDIIPMFDIVPDRCTGFGKRSLLLAGPFGLACWLCGGIFIDRRPGKSRDTMDELSIRLHEQNMRLWIFPEGTRNHGGGLLPFKKGAFHVALQAKIPIIPVVISSYANFYDKNTNKFEHGKMIVTVLPAISTDEYITETIGDLVEKTRNQMVKVFESTSKEVDPNFTMKPYKSKD